MVFKDKKRPFTDNEPDQLAYKHPRQLDHGTELASFVEIVSPIDVPEKPYTSGEDSFDSSQGEERPHTITEFSVTPDKLYENTAHGSISSLSWASTSEDVTPTAIIAQFPSFFEHDRPQRGLIQSEDLFSAFSDFLPRRHVSVGPDHQADVPEWCDLRDSNNPFGPRRHVSVGPDHQADVPEWRNLRGSNNPFGYSRSDFVLMGTCTIPLPLISNSSSSIDSEVGQGRTDDCLCPDAGSVRCVRQHVIEAREKLKETLGQDRFVELGFSNMGEDVAKEWSAEEEQVFQQVVFANPISSGKNFWDDLSLVFPSKTKKDLVSYYFNVFMLRRRVEQNRLDPSSADSDDDEYRGINDTDGFEMLHDEVDSVGESPPDQECVDYIKDNAHEEEELCEQKVWGVGFIDCPKKDMDFLPACDVIQR